MRTLEIDIECYSSNNLSKCGVYKYAEAPDFEILLFGYCVDNGPVSVVDLASGEKIPKDILKALTDENVIKIAHNANFERICLSRFLGMPTGAYLDPKSWQCSMVMCAYNGLPLSLKDAGTALKLDSQKMTEGARLIRKFCVPNKTGCRNQAQDYPEDWEIFKSYNKRDVEVECAIINKLSSYPVPDFVWDEYHLDQEINDRGILIDMGVVRNAIKLDSVSHTELESQLKEITRLENPNSVAQMKKWLSDNGLEVDSLGKKQVTSLLPQTDGEIRKTLELRLQIAKSSVKKYQAMANTACSDNRVRGMFQFYGSRTGRWASRTINVQNLKQNHIEDLESAREVLKLGDYELMKMLYTDVPDTLSQLTRTAFIPHPGYKFIVSDFSSIEARVLSFLAGEKWRLDVFANNGDIYCESASRMFKVPVEKHGRNAHLRQKGKQAELACIAEGQLVLTNHGLIPIESVSTDDLLWDGENWVHHEGVVFKGEKEVITYEGLTATEDHLVWIQGQSQPVQFGLAATCGAHLIQTGDGRKAIRLGEDYISRETLGFRKKKLFCAYKMPRMWKHTMGKIKRFTGQAFKGMPKMLQSKKDSQMVRTPTDESETTMRKPKLCRVQRLRRPWNSIRFSKCNSGWNLDNRESWPTGQKTRNRPNRQQWELCSWKYPFCNKKGELRKQEKYNISKFRTEILALFQKTGLRETIGGSIKGSNYSGRGKSSPAAQGKLASNQCTARLYDIRNAGEHHCFTVSGKLVHNCGYGGATGALRAMGALELGLKEDELQPLVDMWRESNPNIVGYWWKIDSAVKKAIKERAPQSVGNIQFTAQNGMLFITLPSGRRLSYIRPKLAMNQYGSESVTYYGSDAQKKFSRIESYGPKFVENIVQAISRDILAYAMKSLRDMRIVAHVHDELIIECPLDMSVQTICEIMGRTPPWISGLQLRADGYETMFYRKD